jgi:anaphase-promoting complex subunit 5
MHSRDFAQALDDLHRYFDMFATGGINVQYAVLNLAALHLHFGHLEEAMHAINETVRVAQQSNDATALAFAVAWLLRVVQAQNGTRTTRRTASHDAKEEERMLRRCFSCASEEELPHLVRPIIDYFDMLRHVWASCSCLDPQLDASRLMVLCAACVRTPIGVYHRAG